ncbi:hypothetical protein Tco_0603625 [Tanacetum coccineum]
MRCVSCRSELLGVGVALDVYTRGVRSKSCSGVEVVRGVTEKSQSSQMQSFQDGEEIGRVLDDAQDDSSSQCQIQSYKEQDSIPRNSMFNTTYSHGMSLLG